MRTRPLKIASAAIFIMGFCTPLPVPAGPAPQSKPLDKNPVEARLRILEDREEIRQLLVNYGRTLDQRDFQAFAQLFAHNAEYISGNSDSIKGPAAIAKLLQDIFRKNPTGVRSPNFHLFANEIIEVNGDKAVAVSKGLFVVPSQADAPEFVMMATYNDVLVRDQGKWKFKRRVVTGDIPAPSPKRAGKDTDQFKNE